MNFKISAKSEISKAGSFLTNYLKTNNYLLEPPHVPFHPYFATSCGKIRGVDWGWGGEGGCLASGLGMAEVGGEW